MLNKIHLPLPLLPSLPCILCLFIVLLPLLANAQSVAELQQSASSQRFLVRDYQAALAEQQQQYRSQKGEFMPTLGLYYQAKQRRDATISESRQAHSRGIQLSWNLFNGFGDYYRLLNRQQQQQVADLQLQEIQQSVQQEVAQTCLSLHQEQQNLQVALRAEELYQQEQHNAAAKFNVGLLTRNEVLKIEVELENSRLNVNRAETIIHQQLAQLQRQTLCDIQLNTLNFSTFDTLPTAHDLATLHQQLGENNRELQALKKLIDAAGFNHRAARETFLPKADLLADYSRNENELVFDDGDNRDEEFSVQFRISMNLFNGFKDDAALQQARLTAQRASYRYSEREHELRTKLDNTRREFDLAVINLGVAKTNSQQTQENLRITRLAFDQGLTTSAELLDAIFFRTRADLNIIEANSAIFSAHFVLQQLIGAYPSYSVAN